MLSYELLQALTGMSSLRRHVGKGMGSMPVEAVFDKVFADYTAAHRFLALAQTNAGMTCSAKSYFYYSNTKTAKTHFVGSKSK